MIRVATFNVENLFDRPKALNLDDPAQTSAILKNVDALNKELAKATYDKAKIEKLLKDLKGFAIVRVDSGKFYQGQSRSAIVAKGKDDWAGAIELTRERFSDRQRENTAKLLDSLRADAVCMIEVEGRQAMHDFEMEFLPKARRHDRTMLIDSPIDPRGIDVGLAWRSADLGALRSNVYDRRTVGGKSLTVWSRDCLEVELQIAGGRSLHILCNHFKSKFGGDTPDSKAKRKAQAARAREILETRYDLDKDLVILAGDLNDTPDSDPLKPLLTMPKMRDVFDVAGTPASDRWTYFYKPNKVALRRTQIDYILVSKALQPMVAAVNVHRQGMSAVAEGEIPELKPMAGITSWRNAASDHAAITVDLQGIDMP